MSNLLDPFSGGSPIPPRRPKLAPARPSATEAEPAAAPAARTTHSARTIILVAAVVAIPVVVFALGCGIMLGFMLLRDPQPGPTPKPEPSRIIGVAGDFARISPAALRHEAAAVRSKSVTNINDVIKHVEAERKPVVKKFTDALDSEGRALCDPKGDIKDSEAVARLLEDAAAAMEGGK